METLGLVDHTASVYQAEKAGQGRAGCLLVEKQGTLLQQHLVPALLALVVIFPKTCKSLIPFWFSWIIICALENKKLV